MLQYFLFACAAVFSIVIAGCKNEEIQVCACSNDYDEYFFADSTSDSTGVIMHGIAIPNAFSPNADGRNDLFRPLTSGSVTLQLVIIKDGGDIVFQSGSTGWDGWVNGSVPACRTFNYEVDALLNNGTLKHFEGTVTLVNGNPINPCPDNISNCVFEEQFDPRSGFQSTIPSGENFDC